MLYTKLFCSSIINLSNISCADFQSSLESLNGHSLDHPVIIEVLFEVSHLYKSGKSVVFCYVRGHTSLLSDEAADAATEATTLHRTLISDRAVSSDIHIFLLCSVLSLWTDYWADTQSNKLCTVKPSVQAWHSHFSAIRKEEVMVTCPQIGHTCLTNGRLLRAEPAAF
jgi:hypothetical protein